MTSRCANAMNKMITWRKSWPQPRNLEKNQKEAEAATEQAKLNDDATGVHVDENGQRIIALKEVQKEIWLQ